MVHTMSSSIIEADELCKVWSDIPEWVFDSKIEYYAKWQCGTLSSHIVILSHHTNDHYYFCAEAFVDELENKQKFSDCVFYATFEEAMQLASDFE